MQDVSPVDSERFVLRLLLANYHARSWEELRNVSGKHESFYEAARENDLILNKNDEVSPPSNLPERCGDHPAISGFELPSVCI
jgi:hypothetical protein